MQTSWMSSICHIIDHMIDHMIENVTVIGHSSCALLDVFVDRIVFPWEFILSPKNSLSPEDCLPSDRAQWIVPSFLFSECLTVIEYYTSSPFAVFVDRSGVCRPIVVFQPWTRAPLREALSAFCLFLLLPQALLSAASFSPYLRSFPPVIRTRPVGGVLACPLRSSRPAVVRVVYIAISTIPCVCPLRSFFS